jgi:hypothetical protein
MTDRTARVPREERRTHVRYPVKLDLRFLIRPGKVVTTSGEGTSVDISSTGIQFRTPKRLNGGEKVIAAIQWPLTAEGKPLTLLIYGNVVWTKGALVGMSVSHYGFLSHGAVPELENLQDLPMPRYLTPTRSSPSGYANLRQWRRDSR